jgi:hypothetical protein
MIGEAIFAFQRQLKRDTRRALRKTGQISSQLESDFID